MIDSPRVFDADSHFMEPPNFWEQYIDPVYRDRAPKVSEDGRGLIIDGRLTQTIRLKRQGLLHEMWSSTYGEYSSRGWDPEAYRLAMERLGIDQMALYPSRGLMQVGAWGRTQSSPPPSSAPTTATFATSAAKAKAESWASDNWT